MLPNDRVFSSLTWFLPDSGIDSKQDKRDWGSIKLTQRRKRADLGVQGVSKGRIQKAKKKKIKNCRLGKGAGREPRLECQ